MRYPRSSWIGFSGRTFTPSIIPNLGDGMAPSSKYVGSGSHPADPSDSEAGSVERTAARGPWQVLKETPRSATPAIAPTSHGPIRGDEGHRAGALPGWPQ